MRGARSSAVERFSDKEEVEGSTPSVPILNGLVVQWLEHFVDIEEIGGSIPPEPIFYFS